jgi:hypothetical protein
MADPGIHSERNPDGERVQEKSCATTAPTTASAARSYGVTVGKSEHG